jgi:Amidohydrolase family
MRTLGIFLSATALLTAAQAGQTARQYSVVMQGNKAGRQTVAASKTRARAEFTYNDRSHGDHITATWTLDAAGIPIAYDAHGVDYMKARIEEHFALSHGTAIWRSSQERGEQKLTAAAFYIPVTPPPEFYGVLARALLQAPEHRLALLPSGTASIERAAALTLHATGGDTEWIQYRVSGLNFMPTPVWLDRHGDTAAIASLWLSTVAAAEQAQVPQLLDSQDQVDQAWFAKRAKDLTHIPSGDLMIRNARLFDPRDLTVTANTSVLVRGDRIVRVAADSAAPVPDTEIIDAHGRFLMPGLWDNHQHFDGVDGMLDIANGVTSGRDMANDLTVFLKRVARFDAGTEIGPRVLKAGIIDGTGPNAGPFTTLADTPEQALKYVDWYAAHGYVQVKLYMSLKPALVPVIADRAHALGMRVSGHVPAFMSARQFIDAGADEIQHFNYVELNFLYPGVQETTLMSERFIKVAEHARDFSADKPAVRDFITFLKQHHTVLDPTMGLLEDRLAGGAGRITPGLESVAPRFPPQVQRGLLGGAYAAPVGFEDAYREAIPSMLELLKALYDAGVTIIPGTDALAGYMLHHELELYARAGIPPAEVLRMATLTPAQVMGVDRDLGVIAPGKYADMVLIDGDPTQNISDIRNVSLVIKAGKVFEPRPLEGALGIAPR